MSSLFFWLLNLMFLSFSFLPSFSFLQGSTAPDYYAPNITQHYSANAEPGLCSQRGTLLPARPPVNPPVKTPHRKNLTPTIHQRSNRTVAPTTTTTTTSTLPTPTTTSSTTTSTYRIPAGAPPSGGGPPVSGVWGQGVSLNHEKSPSSVVIQALPNDVNVMQQPVSTEETASEELSSRRVVTTSSAASSSSAVTATAIILIALCSTCVFSHWNGL